MKFKKEYLKSFLVVFFLITSNLIFSQTFEEVQNSTFGHGIQTSQPSFYDIDNDNLLDLFISDYGSNGQIRHFEQTSIYSYDFQLINSQFSNLILFHPSKPFFHDIDNDGLLDMLVGVLDGNINHFEQTESGSDEFELLTEYFCGIEDWLPVPNLIDLDGDGLLDMICGRSNGHLSHYEHVAPNSYDFELIDNNFNYIDVGNANRPTFTDIDGDNLIDLIIGEGEESGGDGGDIFYYEQAAPNSYDFVFISDNFLPIDIGKLTTPAFAYIDNDNKLDLIVGELDGNLNLFEQNAQFSLEFDIVSENYLTIDVGKSAFPACKDIDNDGLLDLIIGEYNGNLNLYEQCSIGSFNFDSISDSLLDVGRGKSNPTITDIDNDGLWDLFLGGFNSGEVSHFEQTETETYDFELVTNNFIQVNGGNAALHFKDIDNDNLLDLLVGVHTGNLIHFEQEGVNSQIFNLVSENFSDIDAGSYAIPTTTDLDNNGLIDLLIGVSSNGRIRHYEQVSHNSYDFELVESVFENISTRYMATPTFADINNDRLDDIIAGSYDGGLHLFEHHSDIQLYFTKIEAGDFVNEISTSISCSCSDFDNDEDIDLFITNAWYVNPANTEANFLYKNNGNGTFIKVVDGDIVNFENSSKSNSWGDYNNDGFNDLFVANSGQSGGPNSLFRNNGDGTFTTITDITFTQDINHTQNGVWGDFNNDGMLDLMTTSATGTYLYINLDTETFSERIMINEGYYQGISCIDYDNDNDLDLYLTRYSTTANNNTLYNNDGNGNFTRIYDNIIVSDEGSSPGASWADYDNDCDLDLFVPNSDDNYFYSNNGDGNFTRIYDNSIVMDEGTSISANWGDYNNNGFLDIFVSNRDNENNFLYENTGDGNFERIVTGNIALDIGTSFGCTWFDSDNDGDLDLYVVNRQEKNCFYQNEIGSNSNWIKIKCVGDLSNKSAIGAKVKVKAIINGNPVWQMREISGQSGAWNQNSLIQHFGLGNSNMISHIVIEWPSGIVQALSDIIPNQFITITEPAESSVKLEIETIYSSFDREVIVPVIVSENNYPINSLEINLTEYSDGLEFISINTEETLLDESNWICTANETNNILHIVSIGSQPLQGIGILCYLKFQVIQMEGFVPINFDSIVINTAEMLAETQNGSVNVILPNYGDVDQNGQIQAIDANRILDYLVESYYLDDIQKLNAEVSFDNSVSALDANIILQYVSGIIDSLPNEIGEGYIALGNIQMNDQTVSSEELIETPLHLTGADSIYSFEVCLSYDSNMIEFVSYEYSELLNDFIVESNFIYDNKIYFAGTGFNPINENGEFILLNFLVSEEFDSDSTIVSLDKLRWNENDIQIEPAETILYNSVSTSENPLPLVTKLGSNFPNPFNPSTKINFQLAQESDVDISIYNIKGQKVKQLVRSQRLSGQHSVVWHGKDEQDQPVASSIYFYKLKVNKKTIAVRKCLLLK